MSDVALGARDWGAAAGAARPMAAAGVRDGLWAALIAAIAVAVFSPVLGYDFVNWDDYENLLYNPRYRGLGVEQLRWMAQSVHMGHWIPVTWLTFGLDYVLWGLDPFGYHLTNVLLHGVNAALVFVLARRLLALTCSAGPAIGVSIGAAVGALAFAVHPLRVESVAWVTERRDLVSALFALLTVLAYLRAREPGATHPAAWRSVSLTTFSLALMSKSIVVSLPVVLILLDLYPLRRVAWGQWRQMRFAISDKLPYIVLAGVVAGIAVAAGRLNAIFVSLESVPALDRIGLVSYSAWFYLSRSIVPVGLSPLHGFPASTELWQPRFVLGLVAVLVLSLVAVRTAWRWPGLLVALLAYLVVLAPVSGALQNGYQLVAERYSYLSCLPWALLLGGVVASGMHRTVDRRALLQGLGGLLVVVWLAAVAGVAVQHTAIWRDSHSLWRAAVEADDSCYYCHHLYGIHLRLSGQPEQALAHFARAVSLSPERMLARYLMQAAVTRKALGDRGGAAEDLETLRRRWPKLAWSTGSFMITDW